MVFHLRWSATFAVVFGLAACPGGDGDETAGTDTGASDDTNITTPTGDFDPNPAYRGVLSGTVLGPSLHALDAGNIARARSDAECCQDYAAGSHDDSMLRIVFGAANVGLTLFSDRADEVHNVGAGIDDLKIGDLNGDDRNDIIALRNDGNVAVLLGIDSPPPAGPFLDELTQFSATAGNAVGARSLALGDLDCDGLTDVVVVAPTSDSVNLLRNDNAGGFIAPVAFYMGVGSAPQEVVVGDFDEDGDDDVASSNSDGTMAVRLNMCSGNFDTSTSYTVFLNLPSTAGMTIATGRICRGADTAASLALVVGFRDKVRVICGDGTGDFSLMGEEPI
ncbi:MAG TPA: VCBS repeat-containing protein, partial [Nannocystis sp.]